MRKWTPWLVFSGVLAVAAALPVGAGPVETTTGRSERTMPAMDLTSFSSEPPRAPVDLLFLHHSIGGHLLADQGADDGKWHVHPNGGGLRTLLTRNNYRVHDATYGSKLGEHTDMFDWLPKFRDHMDEVLRIDTQDTALPDGRKNRVVLFKSCFPNNYFVAEGTPPGSASGPDLSLENARATLRALLPLFARHKDTLFIYLTTPPIVGVAAAEPAYKWLLKKALGRPSAREQLATQGRLARRFNDWAAASDGWLADYPAKNVAVFHLYDVLTDHGASDFSRHASGDGTDNHPNHQGLAKVAQALVPFINRALSRADLGAGSDAVVSN
jgi:hypothetical protein